MPNRAFGMRLTIFAGVASESFAALGEMRRGNEKNIIKFENFS